MAINTSMTGYGFDLRSNESSADGLDRRTSTFDETNKKRQTFMRDGNLPGPNPNEDNEHRFDQDMDITFSTNNDPNNTSSR